MVYETDLAGWGWGFEVPQVLFLGILEFQCVQIGQERHPQIFVGQMYQGFEAAALQPEMLIFEVFRGLTEIDDAIPETMAVS